MKKILSRTMLVLLAVLITVVVDFITGYRGWSVDYVLPAGIVLVDVVILGCMFFNRRNWQSIFCAVPAPIPGKGPMTSPFWWHS